MNPYATPTWTFSSGLADWLKSAYHAVSTPVNVTPPLPPAPHTPEQGVYFFPTGIVECRGRMVPPPVPGHCYVGYAYGAMTPKIERWVGPGPLVFVGAELELGQIYFAIPVHGQTSYPTAYFWKWVGRGWAYLGELPVFE